MSADAPGGTPDALARDGAPDALPKATGRARDLVRTRRGTYTAPETGRHHHLGSAPERQPLLDEGGAAYVETSAVQLAERTVTQLGQQADRLRAAMAAASADLDFERAAALRDDLAAVEAEVERRAQAPSAGTSTVTGNGASGGPTT